jgi:hypothetical protein
MPRFSVWTQTVLTKVTSLASDDAFALATNTPEAKAIERDDLIADIASDVLDELPLTTDGDLLTQAAGARARITRADLAADIAADTAFTSAFAKRVDIAYKPGGTGNNGVNTPGKASIDLAGDIDVRVYAKTDNTVGTQVFVRKGDVGTERSYQFETSSTAFRVRWWNDGTVGSQVLLNSTVAIPNPTVFRWRRFTVSNSAQELKFFTSVDGVTWTQTGATISNAALATTFPGTGPLNLVNDPSTVSIQNFELRDGIEGSIVAQWQSNPPMYPRYLDAYNNIWSVTGSTGVWTVA